jgi:PAS domain S-box-containing protein
VGSPRRTWALAGAAAIAAVALADALFSPGVTLGVLVVVGPLLAAIGGSARCTAVLAAVALAYALGDGLVTGLEAWRLLVRALTVGLGGGLAVVLADLRTRLERRTEEAGEATRRAEESFALLEVIFDRAPVGLAFYDRDCRFVRVNERLAEINGVSVEAHAGRTVAEVVPGLPDVAEGIRQVVETGRPAIEVEVSGETPAQPGVQREWLASYWPVRVAGERRIGVGAVVFEVTDRRAAERDLRTQTDRYETLLLALSEVGEGMVVLEDGRCVYVNAAFEQISGYTFPELAAMDSVFDLVDEELREEAAERARLRMERGLVDPSFTLAIRRRDDKRVLLELAGVPLEVEGRRQLVVVVRDVTGRATAERERERLLRRSALLAEASALFDESLDEERTVERVARLCVRDLADTCLVVLGGGMQPVRRAIVVARDPELEAHLAGLDLDAVLFPSSGAVAQALRSGRGLVFEPDHPTARGVAVAAVAPLSARGRVLGAVAVGFRELAEEDRDEVLVLLEDLGRRAALALDNSRLYEERREVADTLQRSLLPPDLPDIPGVEVAARYLAAGAGNEVGGDFYDCFATGGGDWALVMGDVCGKGAEAAAITAIARYTLRASVLHNRQPRRVLTELNEALLRQRLDYRFCTVLYASVTPRAAGVEAVLATGGHPLPLVLRASGEVEVAGVPGTLLGILDDVEISEERVLLRPGDSLVLYTDGVVEASPLDDALGPDQLVEFLAGNCRGAGAAEVARAIEEKALAVQDGRLRDDVAVMVMRVHGDATAPFPRSGSGVATEA